jgi:uncharacterized protein YndB with AHSA1/START domain
MSRVTVRRRFDASAEALFDAWVEPASLAAWMHPGQIVRYRLIERPQRLVFTWRSPDMPGDSLVSVEFHPGPGATEVVVTHEIFDISQPCSRESTRGQ